MNHPCGNIYPGQVICSLLYGPHKTVQISERKIHIFKSYMQNFSNTFTRHNSSIDEVCEYKGFTQDVVIKQPSRNMVTIIAPKCASSKVQAFLL